MIHFVRTFLIMRAYGARIIPIEEARNYERFIYIKNIFQNGWWDEALPFILPL